MACATAAAPRHPDIADVQATRTLLETATEQAVVIMTQWQALALPLVCEGHAMAVIAAQLDLRSRQHLWAAYRRPVVEAVTREFLAVMQAAYPPN